MSTSGILTNLRGEKLPPLGWELAEGRARLSSTAGRGAEWNGARRRRVAGCVISGAVVAAPVSRLRILYASPHAAGFVIDQGRCIGCHACTVACKSENEVPLGDFRTWVKYTEEGAFPSVKRSFTVLRCNQCTAAPCVAICPVTALDKRRDGIVDIDPSVCIGAPAGLPTTPCTSTRRPGPPRNATSARIGRSGLAPPARGLPRGDHPGTSTTQAPSPS